MWISSWSPPHACRQVMPSVASQVQDKTGLKNAGAIDIAAACAGFAYGIILAQGLIAAGTHRKILVFGAETLTKVPNYEDRTSCILFGDGAGAVVEAAPKGNILGAVTGSSGDGGKDLYLSHMRKQINGQDVITDHKIHQNGRAVFKWAVNTVSEQMEVLAGRSHLKLEEIDWFVPHSANMRIIEALCNQSGFPLEKTLENYLHLRQYVLGVYPAGPAPGRAGRQSKKRRPDYDDRVWRRVGVCGDRA